MAEKRQQPSATVKLSSICLGGRSIRFLVLRDKKFIKAPETLEESQGVPLFLASDVLCRCSQMQKNFTRIHARYSKDGMATKLLLKDFRVNGVSHSTTVWFYNIRGVFQVIFEYQEKSVQRDCLSKLKDMWLCRYYDDNLPESLEVTLDVFQSNFTKGAHEKKKPFEPCKDENNKGQELFPLTGGEIVVELIKQERNSSDNFESRPETITSNNSKDQQRKINGIFYQDNSVNDKDIPEDITVEKVSKAGYSQACPSDSTPEHLDVSCVGDTGQLCHSCGSLDCPSFQYIVKENGEISWGICLASRLESMIDKPLCCSKATQIDTVPRSVSKNSVGIQTDQFVSVVNDSLENVSGPKMSPRTPKSKAIIHRNAAPQTDINMEMFAVLTPNCINCTNNRNKSHKKFSLKDKKKLPQANLSLTSVMKGCVKVLESLLQYLAQVMQTDLQTLELSPVIKRFSVLLQLLIQDMHRKESEGFPLQLIQDYLDKVGRETTTDVVFDSWGNSPQRNATLNIVSHWLGQEFHKFEPKISQRVEDFKQTHINCIDNLPPAESIVDIVFPSFMKELIVCWTSQSHPSPSVTNDHDYSPPVKKLCSSPAYPLVQHILEFANHALVSGVAHVVYSRLRHST
ncbi:uncharacterized protein [Argopecten irradians]|uniref:uncharacterized protein n=1 Tax=Argopecten irradians TaxID=31199 RepID=UPI003716646C